ncbi:MAG: zf-HC2 domain-containing protein [Phycisphaerales bacterium]|nr:zf-HC2 domain-containing protein [Phycisphaerales bacterium]
MNCAEARRHLTIFADDELSSPLREHVGKHAASCAECARIVANWREFRASAARRHAALTAPAGLQERIAAAIQPARAARVQSRPTSGRLRVLVAGLAAAASFGAMVTVAYRTFWMPDGSQSSTNAGLPAISPLALAGVHERCACASQHNVLHRTDALIAREEAQLRAARKFDVVLPNLDTFGYELAGICECPINERVPIVHAFYRSRADAAQFISVFSFKSKMRLEGCGQGGACGKKDERTYDEFVDTAKKIVCLKWDEGRCSYAICSDQSRETLQTIADQIHVTPVVESKSR